MKRISFFILFFSSVVHASDTVLMQPEVLIAFIRQFNQQKDLIMSLQDQLLFCRNLLEAKDQAISYLNADINQLQFHILDQRRKIVELEINIMMLEARNTYLYHLIGRLTH